MACAEIAQRARVRPVQRREHRHEMAAIAAREKVFVDVAYRRRWRRSVVALIRAQDRIELYRFHRGRRTVADRIRAILGDQVDEQDE